MAPKRTASPLKNVPAGSKGAKESNRNKTPPKDSSRKKKVVKKKKPSKDDGLAKIEEVGVEVRLDVFNDRPYLYARHEIARAIGRGVFIGLVQVLFQPPIPIVLLVRRHPARQLVNADNRCISRK